MQYRFQLPSCLLILQATLAFVEESCKRNHLLEKWEKKTQRSFFTVGSHLASFNVCPHFTCQCMCCVCNGLGWENMFQFRKNCNMQGVGGGGVLLLEIFCHRYIVLRSFLKQFSAQNRISSLNRQLSFQQAMSYLSSDE